MGHSEKPKGAEAFERQAQLEEQVFSARRAYENARAEANRLLQLAHDAGADHPDGSHALLLAARIQREATSRYVEALKRFSDFVLHR